jgi:type I restriction enzyme S subunit
MKWRRWSTNELILPTLTRRIGDKLRFRKGDIIFGRRRAYQRKLAVAEFDGICSAHAMVVRAKNETVDPEFLPFFMQSDLFMQRAIDISVGSLSPTINWTTLRIQEFPLPPTDEQRRIADILWAADESVESYVAVADKLTELSSQLLTRFTTIGCGSPSTTVTQLGSIASHWHVETVEDVTSLCQYGLSIPLNETGKVPILRMMNYDDGEIVANDLKYVDLEDREFREFRLERNDILFNRTNSADLVGKVGIFRLEGDYVFASYLVRLRANTQKVLPEYLNAYLNSNLGQRRLLAYATPGVSQTNISAGSLKKVLVPVPPMEEQPRIVDTLESLKTQRRAVLRHTEAVRQLKSHLMDILLTPRETA